MTITPVGPGGPRSLPGAAALVRGTLTHASRPSSGGAGASRTDQVSLSSTAKALAQPGAGDDAPELQLSPAQLRALISPDGGQSAPLKPATVAGDSSINTEERHVR